MPKHSSHRDKILAENPLLNYVDKSQWEDSPIPETYKSFHCQCKSRCKTTETKEQHLDGRILWKVKWHPCREQEARECIEELRSALRGGEEHQSKPHRHKKSHRHRDSHQDESQALVRYGEPA